MESLIPQDAHAPSLDYWPICTSCGGDLTIVTTTQTNAGRLILSGARFRCPKGCSVNPMVAPYRVAEVAV